MLSSFKWLTLSALLLAGCHLITDVGDLTFGPLGSGGSTANATGGQGGAGGMGSAGEGGMGGSPSMPCDETTDCGVCQSCNLTDGLCQPEQVGANCMLDSKTGVCDGRGQCAVGERRWAHLITKMHEKNPRAVATDSKGNVYVTGYFKGPLPGPDGSPNPADYRAAVIKYDNTGEAKWSWVLPSTSFSAGTAIEVADNGDIYLGGVFQGKVDNVDTGTSRSAFVARLTESEDEPVIEEMKTFLRIGADNGEEDITGLCLKDNGNVIVTGNFSQSLDIEGVPSTGGENRVFVISLNSALDAPSKDHVVWGKTGSQYAYSLDCTKEPGAPIVVAGDFNDDMGIANASGDGPLINTGASRHGFVLKLKADLDIDSLEALGSGDNPAFAGGIAIDKTGNIAVMGMFKNEVAFGSSASITTNANHALFLARRSAADDQTDITELGSPVDFSPVASTPAMALAFDPHSNLVLTAPFVGELKNLGADNMGSKDDVFVAKFASALAAPNSLKLLWLRIGEESTAGDNAQQPFGLTVGKNQIAITGITHSDMKFAGTDITPTKKGPGPDGFIGVVSP